MFRPITGIEAEMYMRKVRHIDKILFIKIIVATICTLHLLVMLILYLEVDIFSDVWEHYLSDDLAHIVLRSPVGFLIAWIFSVVLFFFVLKLISSSSIGTTKYIKAAGLFLVGVYFFYLSGQNLIINMGNNKIEEYFSVFKIRTVFSPDTICPDANEHEQSDGLFYARFTNSCDTATVLSGIGPFLKLK